MPTDQALSSDILVIGAGVIGSSVAFHLARLGAGTVRVLDLDLEGSLSSSELNAGGVRATFNQPINIAMSKVTLDYFATVAAEVGYRACGYLWLHGPERLPAALAARERQLAMGCEVQAWDIAELRRRAPLIDKTDGIASALFSPRDGLVNPNRLKHHYRERARGLGVSFEDRVRVIGAEYDASGARLECERYPRELGAEARLALFSGRASAVSPQPARYRARRVINCAGAWAASVARALGYETPVHPQRRQICLFDCRGVDLSTYGMIVDTSGVYFHPEATNGLAGFATPGEPPTINFEYDGETFFMERIWPALYERASAFERLKHLTGWSGQYEVSPDESAVIGPVARDSLGRAPDGTLFEAHSFSGHGVMHCHAAGVALGELLAGGRYETVEAAPLAGARFGRGERVAENMVI